MIHILNTIELTMIYQEVIDLIISEVKQRSYYTHNPGKGIIIFPEKFF